MDGRRKSNNCAKNLSGKLLAGRPHVKLRWEADSVYTQAEFPLRNV
jgi:hypothetical protein